MRESDDNLGFSSDRNRHSSGRLLTIGQVSELLQVPVSWVYGRTRGRSANRIPGFRLGKYWRFDETEIRGWLSRQAA